MGSLWNGFVLIHPVYEQVISGEPNSEHREFAASGNHREGERTHSHSQGRAQADSSI